MNRKFTKQKAENFMSCYVFTIMIMWSRKWQPTPIFLPGEFQGQRRLVGYNPWGRKESDTDTTEHYDNNHFKALPLP